jgi:hypothetical protein
MGTEIESALQHHLLKEFFGGKDKGVCLQITAVEPGEPATGYLQLDLVEAAELAYQLGKYCEREAKRRQAILKEQIVEMKELEKTVYREVADMDIGQFKVTKLLVGMVNSLTPK